MVSRWRQTAFYKMVSGDPGRCPGGRDRMREGEPFLRRADRFLDAFSDLPLDVNLLVYTREEMNRMLAKGNRLARAIVEGVRLGREEGR